MWGKVHRNETISHYIYIYLGYIIEDENSLISTELYPHFANSLTLLNDYVKRFRHVVLPFMAILRVCDNLWGEKVKEFLKISEIFCGDKAWPDITSFFALETICG